MKWIAMLLIFGAVLFTVVWTYFYVARNKVFGEVEAPKLSLEEAREAYASGRITIDEYDRVIEKELR